MEPTFAPHPFFYVFLFLKLFPPTHPPTHLYIQIKNKLCPIYLVIYKFKCVNFISTNLPTPHLFFYLPIILFLFYLGTYQTPSTWLHLPTWLAIQ